MLRLVERADALLEGFRPGVMERLGLGPDVCLARNPRLVYGRMTGCGQEGPIAQAAGPRHQLHRARRARCIHIGRAGEKPLPPLNLVGDFGGGGMLLAFGVVCALVERAALGQGPGGRRRDGRRRGGADDDDAHLPARRGMWSDERGTNLLDTGAHFYETYETKDGKYVSIGSIEPQFYAELLKRTGLEGEDAAAPDGPRAVAGDEGAAGGDLQVEDARRVVRRSWRAPTSASRRCSRWARPTSIRTTWRAAPSSRSPASCSRRPAPRFSRTPPAIAARRRPTPGQHTDDALRDWGFSDADLRTLRDAKAIA